MFAVRRWNGGEGPALTPPNSSVEELNAKARARSAQRSAKSPLEISQERGLEQLGGYLADVQDENTDLHKTLRNGEAVENFNHDVVGTEGRKDAASIKKLRLSPRHLRGLGKGDAAPVLVSVEDKRSTIQNRDDNEGAEDEAEAKARKRKKGTDSTGRPVAVSVGEPQQRKMKKRAKGTLEEIQEDTRWGEVGQAKGLAAAGEEEGRGEVGRKTNGGGDETGQVQRRQGGDTAEPRQGLEDSDGREASRSEEGAAASEREKTRQGARFETESEEVRRAAEAVAGAGPSVGKDRADGASGGKKKRKGRLQREGEGDGTMASTDEAALDEDRNGYCPIDATNGAEAPPDKEALPEQARGSGQPARQQPEASPASKPPPVLPWMRAPVEIGAADELRLEDVPGLDPRLEGALRAAGLAALFPVQAAVWREMVGPGGEARDVCVCAPTGSGKTLAYALPVLQGLAARGVRRLRALVVLPTRDLAGQVKAVFDSLAPSVGLAVGLAVGQTSLRGEGALLVDSGRAAAEGALPWDPQGGAPQSLVDILVATPGRLMDHLTQTRGFSLQHLRYLVVDESDRLLRQAYQGWLPRALAASSGPPSLSGDEPGPAPAPEAEATPAPEGEPEPLLGSICTIRRRGTPWGQRSAPSPRLVKLVLSATLTRDPSKIARLGLHSPLYIASSASDHRYKLPAQLQEFKLVCPAGEKPLVLVALLRALQGQPTLVFTASVEATHRLFLLLQAFEGLPAGVVEYSSLQHQRARSAALEEFRSGHAQVLVASDAMTRGMDVESVANVVSYDVPVYAKTYVHRVGRTARAGRTGRAFTILRKEEVRHFKDLLRKADNNFCKDYRLPPAAVEELVPQYTAALEVLKRKVEEEAFTARKRGVDVAANAS